MPVYDAKTLEQRLSDSLARPKFYTVAIVFLASLAALMAAIGTYGAAAYSVTQRKREMGLRMALGSTRQRVRALVVREHLVPIAVGMSAGLIGALAAGQYLESLIAGAKPIDPWVCVLGASLLLLGGFIAAWIATSQVLSIDPADALRAE